MPASRFAAALSAHPVPAQAVGEVLGSVLEQLAAAPNEPVGPAAGRPPDLAVLFATGAHTGAFEDVAAAVRQVLRPGVLLGATAVSVLGGAEELEAAPGLALWAASFPPGVGPSLAVRLDTVSGQPGPDGAEGWAVRGLPAAAVDPDGDPRTLVVLGDPFSFPADVFVDRLHERHSSLAVVGGLASSGRAPGGNRLVLDGTTYDDGAVGVVLPAGVRCTAVVSQGCRPIGDPMTVTRAERNVLYELASEGALEKLTSLIGGLAPDERALAARGLHLGRVIDERAESTAPGDFLIRGVLGATRDTGAIVVGEAIEVGATVQFQVRDAGTADDELRAMLAGRSAASALVFTCNGRGAQLFGRPHHDAELVEAVAGPAVAGMFCAGEIGPVGGRSFLHGFTASVLLFDSPVAPHVDTPRDGDAEG